MTNSLIDVGVLNQIYARANIILDWIRNLPSSGAQQVIVDGCVSSDSLPVLSGVPQGTVLSPLLLLC